MCTTLGISRSRNVSWLPVNCSEVAPIERSRALEKLARVTAKCGRLRGLARKSMPATEIGEGHVRFRPQTVCANDE